MLAIWRSMLPLALLLLLSSAPSPVESAVHAYNGAGFKRLSDAFVLKGGHEGMFAGRGQAGHGNSSTDDGKSYIKLSGVTFSRPEAARRSFAHDEGFTGLVEAVVFETSQRSLIGYETEDGWKYCCTEEWAKKTKCRSNRLYIAPHGGALDPEVAEAAGETVETGQAASDTVVINSTAHSGFPWHTDIDFLNDDRSTNVPLKDKVRIVEAGMYSLWFVICDPALEEVTATGESVWKGPTGYLPGGLHPLLPFHASLSFLYVILGITWLGLHLLNTSTTFAQQHLITASVSLGMLVSCIDYAELWRVNQTGIAMPVIRVFQLLLSSTFLMFVRLTVLLLSRGFGTMRPSGADRPAVTFAVLYWCAELVLRFKRLHDRRDDEAVTPLLYGLPLTLLEIYFVTAIAFALRTTLRSLGAKGSSVRLNMYMFFAGAMVVIISISFAYVSFEIYFNTVLRREEKWQFTWMHSTFWQLVHVSTVAVLCTLWAPGELVQSYIHHEHSSDIDDSHMAALAPEATVQLGKSD